MFFFHTMVELFKLLPLLLFITLTASILMRLVTKVAQPKRDYSFQPKVSVLLPVYNEGENIVNTLTSIIAADWPRDKLEIIAFDDCSKDDSMTYVRAIAEQHPGLVIVGQNPKNSGKHLTVLNASRIATGEIFIIIDSDCIFDKNVIKELVSCYCDERVGAVGGAVGITNVNDNVYTMAQSVAYFRSIQLGKVTQILQGCVSCISGCLFSLRAEIFRDLEHDIENLNWLGVKVRSGEDRFMSHLIMLRGWRTLINTNAFCWTSVPNTFNVLYKQQLRWARGALRDMVWTLATLPRNFKAIGVVRTLNWLMPPVLTMLGIFFIFSCVFLYGPGVFWRASAMGFAGAFWIGVVSALAYNIFSPKLMPGSQKISQPLLAGLFHAWGLISVLLHIIAIFTFDQDAWGTRENVVQKPQEPGAGQ